MTTVKNTKPRPQSIKGNLATVLAQAAQYGEFEFAMNTGEIFSGDEFSLSIQQYDLNRTRQAYEIGHIREEETVHVGFLNYLEPDATLLEQHNHSKRKDSLDQIAYKHKLIVLTDPIINDHISFSTQVIRTMLNEAYEAGQKA